MTLSPLSDAGRILRWVNAQRMELILVALTLLATVTMSFLTLRQTTSHFRIERTTSFVARFNSQEMVSLREDVDRWLETKETAKSLYERSTSQPVEAGAELRSAADAARGMVAKLRTMANFFQEFGSAIKAGSLDEDYAQELLGAVCVRYAVALEPFILETRVQRKRVSAYQEVFWLKDRMAALDAK